MQQTQLPGAAEPKNEHESVSPDNQLKEQLKCLNASYDEGHLVKSGVFRDHHIKQLQQFPNLRNLTVVADRLTNEALLHISDLHSLTTLDLRHADFCKFTGRGLAQLTRLRNARLIKVPSSWPSLDELSRAERAAARSKVIAMLEQALPGAVVE